MPDRQGGSMTVLEFQNTEIINDFCFMYIAYFRTHKLADQCHTQPNVSVGKSLESVSAHIILLFFILPSIFSQFFFLPSFISEAIYFLNKTKVYIKITQQLQDFCLKIFEAQRDASFLDLSRTTQNFYSVLRRLNKRFPDLGYFKFSSRFVEKNFNAFSDLCKTF